MVSLAEYASFIDAEHQAAKDRGITTVGAYAHAYEFVFALISRDNNGDKIFTIDSSGNLINRKGNIVDLTKWNIKNEADADSWRAADGVDLGSWVFLGGVPSVNRDEGDYSTFIREYTSNQYYIRFGRPATDQKIQMISNGIAENIMIDITKDYESPTIHQIAKDDASAAAKFLFTISQIAGWAGNPFLLAVGHTASYYDNIINEPGNTYNVLAMIRAMQQTGFSGDFTGIQLFGLLRHTLHASIVTSALEELTNAAIKTILHLEGAYGFVGRPLISIPSSTILLGRGADQNDILEATNDSEYIHGGGGDDTIIGSSQAGVTGYDKDIADGGAGNDLLDFSKHSVNFLVKSTTQGLNKFRLEVDNESTGSLFATTYAYNIETLKIGRGNDTIHIDNLTGSELIQIDAGSGADVISVTGIDTTLSIYVGSGNDTVEHAPEGSIIYGEAGADVFLVGKNYLIADADANDRIEWLGRNLTGGLRFTHQESPWAYGIMGERYGINPDGELVIRDWFGSETFVRGFNNNLDGPYTAGILVGEIHLDAYRLIDAPPGFFYDTWKTVMGYALKAMTGTSYFNGVDPLVLDLDRDGIELTARTAGSPFFDIDGDNFAEQVGWVRRDDGFLALDRNGNGRIDSVNELFGNGGTGGFASLAKLDSNKDRVIDAKDTEFGKLVVWRDLDGDAVTDAGELTTLDKLGIVSIKLTANWQDNERTDGNEIYYTSTFTRRNGTTGTIADVILDANQRDTKWLGDLTPSDRVMSLPEITGHGTLTDLRIAMTDSNALRRVVERALPEMDTPNLDELRETAMPIFSEWMKPFPVPPGTPGQAPHADVAALISLSLESGIEVHDFAFRVVDDEGTYWKLASGHAVRDDVTNRVITRPTFQDVLEQSATDGEWTRISGEQIRFAERYMGIPLPIGEYTEGSGRVLIDAGETILKQIWETLNLTALKMAVQGPLKSYFESIHYNPETDLFEATTPRQLVPLLENLLDAAPESASGALGYLTQWKQALSLFLHNYDRGEDHLSITYGYLFQNLVAAYENAGSAATLEAVAGVLDLPVDLIRLGNEAGGQDADIFYLGKGNQTVNGGIGPDTYVIGRNFGRDVIQDREPELSASPDMLRFAHLNADQVTMERNGLDLIIRVNGATDTLTVKNHFTSPISAPGFSSLEPDFGIDEIVFANGTVWDLLDIAKAVARSTAGDDRLIGTPSTDFFDGGKGNDRISGQSGSDVYFFGRGDGQDVIDDHMGYLYSNSPDMLRFKEGIVLDDLSFSHFGASSDLIIKIKGTRDQITILKQYDVTYTGVYGSPLYSNIESFYFADGRSLSYQDIAAKVLEQARTDRNDKIYGFSLEDTLDGGAGNDYLSGGNESDIYVMGLGYGRDTISENRDSLLSGSEDRITFLSGIIPSEIDLSRPRGTHDLVITLKDGSILHIKDQFDTYDGIIVFGEHNRIEYFQFADGTVWNAEDVKLRLLAEQSTSGHDSIEGYVFSNDTITGGRGNDTLDGMSGDDTYLYLQGDGHDVIIERMTEGDRDLLKLNGAGLTSKNVIISRVETDDVLESGVKLAFKGVAGSITLQHQAGGWYNEGIDRIQFSDGVTWNKQQLQDFYVAQQATTGNDSIQGFVGYRETLAGGRGNDTLDGMSGDDVYLYQQGDGHDVIIERMTEGDRDLLKLSGAGLTSKNVIISRVETDDELESGVKLAFKGVAGSITLQHQAVGWYNDGIDRIQFSDGVTWNKQQLENKYLAAAQTEGADTIIGFSSNDTIYGRGGGDHINGFWGNDVYAYKAISDSTGSQYDVIHDFMQYEDRVDLRGLGYTRIDDGAPRGTALGYQYNQREDLTFVTSTDGLKIAFTGYQEFLQRDFMFD